MSRPATLIVDDEPDIRELLEITLERMGIDTHARADVAGAFEALESRHFDLCLADMRLPDGNGIEIVRHIGQNHPDTPVAMITAHGSMETAIEALKAGAFDFVSKPIQLSELRRLVETAIRAGKPKAKPTAQSANRLLLGNSAAIQQIHRLIEKLGRSQAPVFITGESGTGKELAAHAIHASSPRANHPFIAINCGAIPSELMESELFGHTRGSFSGATTDRKGLFRAAEGGTLFLDEVADLPLHMQVKLLRAIQEKRIRPVGASTEKPIDVRLISATHKNMQELVANGQFRQDLFFRIHVIELHMPPLREHMEDLPILVKHFLEKHARASGQPTPSLSAAAMELLRNHPFPGNIRELENLLERACALCDGHTIRPDDLGLRHAQPPARPGLAGKHTLDLESELHQVERDLILKVLEDTGWNRTETARRLSLTPRSLRYRMQKLGLTSQEK